ncbi:superoxide dismutase [Brevibacillus gelatini]|uniref:superoxide dismutase n=1 Tax=Brevibacillus gelatini TaxID=1655277 RepID=UPI003D81A3E6
MEEKTRKLLDWSQWGRQWIDHLRRKKTLNRELERHLHKFEESFIKIGRQATQIHKQEAAEALPILIARAEEVQKQFHHFLRLTQLAEDERFVEQTVAKDESHEELLEAEAVQGATEACEATPAQMMEMAISAPYQAVRETAREPIRVARPVAPGRHTLPPLPYAYNALEPYIDEQTMRIHHEKLHQKYVDDLNTAERKLVEARQSGNYDLIRHWERELAFHGAGHYLHSIFWPSMSPHGGGTPTGELAEAIQRYFGSFDAFRQQFSQAAGKVEGPGWAILVWSPRAQHLEILTAEKHQNLAQWDAVPLLVLDVWEHAYFLQYQNQRDKYVENWWNIVNWPYVQERFQQARKLRWEPF